MANNFPDMVSWKKITRFLFGKIVVSFAPADSWKFQFLREKVRNFFCK